MRFGSAEDAILYELRRTGGPVPRQLLVGVVYASSSSGRRSGWSRAVVDGEGMPPEGRARQNAESTLSRALRSLERKGLIVRIFSRQTKQNLISVPDPPAPPSWERDAGAEEAFASRCDAISVELAELARRARARAARLRVQRHSASTSDERDSDVARGVRLMSLGVTTASPA